MSEHTKEPWGISHDSHDGWPLVMAGGKIIANVNLESFNAGVADLIEMPAESNARRIVACVNACAGISTEQLEKDAAVGGEQAIYDCLKATTDEAVMQRDKLLAALKSRGHSLGCHKNAFGICTCGLDAIITEIEAESSR